MADILLKKKIYKDRMEQFLVNIVFPEFNSPHGHLRARACWMLHYFADVKYKDPNVLGQAFQLTIDSLLKPGEEVPVKVSGWYFLGIFGQKTPKKDLKHFSVKV